MSSIIASEELKELILSVYRFDPSKDTEAYMQEIRIEVPANKDLMVLDALHLAKEKDPSLSFRRSFNSN